MKIEIDIPDDLFAHAERVAETRGTCLPALIEAGLRQVLAGPLVDQGCFRLRKHTFGGEGLHPDLASAGWDEIRALANDRCTD